MNTTIGCPIPGASQPKQQPKTIVKESVSLHFLNSSQKSVQNLRKQR